MSTAVGGTVGGHTRAGVRFGLWRHRDATVRAAPRTHLGDRELPDDGDAADEARQVYELGARFVSVEPVVELGGHGEARRTIRALSLVRELTSRGLDVDWRARIASGGPPWWVFSHLFPPSALEGPGADEALALWRSQHHVGKCFLRRGPGFVQIRDRRRGGLRRLTIVDAEYLSAMDALLADRGTGSVPDRVRSVFESQHLLVPIGGGVWWAPYRLRRWPLPSWEV